MEEEDEEEKGAGNVEVLKRGRDFEAPFLFTLCISYFLFAWLRGLCVCVCVLVHYMQRNSHCHIINKGGVFFPILLKYHFFVRVAVYMCACVIAIRSTHLPRLFDFWTRVCNAAGLGTVYLDVLC